MKNLPIGISTLRTIINNNMVYIDKTAAATVDANGVVAAVEGGAATITVTTADDPDRQTAGGRHMSGMCTPCT